MSVTILGKTNIEIFNPSKLNLQKNETLVLETNMFIETRIILLPKLLSGEIDLSTIPSKFEEVVG
jgi:hypothetical protein